MILALLAALQVSAADSLPRITLAEALAQGVRLSPDYVRSIGSISSAEWSRKAATLAFVIPSVYGDHGLLALLDTPVQRRYRSAGHDQCQLPAVRVAGALHRRPPLRGGRPGQG